MKYLITILFTTNFLIGPIKCFNQPQILHNKILDGGWKCEPIISSPFESKNSTENRTMIFANEEAIFFSDDSIIRKTTYNVSISHAKWGFVITGRFYLRFADNDEEWTVHFIDKNGFPSTMDQAYPTRILINKTPNCVCGCPQEFLKRITDKKVVIHK